ncbi:zinc-binding dehydrogenase [Paenibacillus sp. OV219]|uniref:zinc-binding dehydrogenase n=1 Tax=Paenibacillus sp. OV219 TaxID=1884377 RepID=UPI0008D4D7F7|nr:zinc-binding dehydrogenase [Paenibacillus sp. OV219]SEO13333.1 2-desacetyl-2-hydroxyethyl bacteriochlorophyllide A dehydrogenase [Paenibacillus sp. OV219]
MEARAVVFVNKNEITVRDVEVPEPGARDVVIDVAHSWISIGTESSFLRGERISGETPYREDGPWPFPQVAGYQKVGRVTQVGELVDHVKLGDLVFATVSKVDGMYFDFAGHINPAVTDCSQVWKLPGDGRGAVAYAGAVLAQVGYNCGIRPPVEPGDIAVVIGDGLVGHWAAQTLAHRDAQVYLLGHRAERLAFASAGGYAVPIDGVDVAVDEIQRGRSGNRKVAIVVDTVGHLETFRKLQPLMKRDSHLVSAGYLGEQGFIDIQTLREQEITLHTPSGWTESRIDATIAAIREGWLMTEPLITHRFAAEDAAQAWALITSKGSPCLGVVLDWDMR